MPWYYLVRQKSKEVNAMAWRLKINFDDGTSELEEEIFATREEAEEAKESWLIGYYAGRDVLEEAGRSFCEANIEDFDIWEE